MGTIGSGLLAAAVGVAVLAPSAASANAISEPFTITQLPAVSADGLGLFSDVAAFNPADDTLTSVSASLTGTATWTSTADTPSLFALLSPGNPANDSQLFFTPGTITFAISDNPTDLNDFKGTGSVHVLLALATSDTGDTFATGASGLMGTITYTYTPSASFPVPEPSTWAMLLLGFAGLGLLGYRKTRGDNALAQAGEGVAGDAAVAPYGGPKAKRGPFQPDGAL
jgi:hypothetical protein